MSCKSNNGMDWAFTDGFPTCNSATDLSLEREVFTTKGEAAEILHRDDPASVFAGEVFASTTIGRRILVSNLLGA